MKKYAAIDIGTNSMRLLLAQVNNSQILSREKYIEVIRIGSAVDKDKKISQEGMVRNINALEEFAKKAREYGAEKILAMATSAVRDASNGHEFIKRAYEKTGVNIKIISGEEEAFLGYKGVAIGLNQKNKPWDLGKLKESVKLPKEEEIHFSNQPYNNLVIDIGGGSTELILGQGLKLKEAVSLNIGAVRMTERHISTDPVTREEYKKLSESVETAICNLKTDGHGSFGFQEINEKATYNLIGIGGTITTLAALHQELDPYNPDKVHNYKLTLKEINELKEKLVNLTVEEIKQLKGIQAKRADIILAGLTILSIIMKNLGLNEIAVSEYDNLEGLVYKAINF